MDRTTLLAVIVFVFFCISTLPVLYVGFFAHPVADDFNYSSHVHHALVNGGDIIHAVAETVASFYMRWQGTFSAVAVFSLQPAVFSPSYYFLTTFIMVGFLTGSTFFLFITIVKRMMHGRTAHAVILSCLILIMSIQFVPNANQAFFWFNGSAYYTLFYSLALIFFTLLLRLRITESPRHTIVLFVLALILGLFIGGGNYSTALITAELTVLITGIEFYRKSARKWLFVAILLSFFASFIINAAAPGNAVRAASVTGLHPIKAIAQSLFFAMEKAVEWTGVPQFVFVAAMALLSVFLVPKYPGKFSCPIFVLGLAFSVFASQMTPPLYAMSNIGAGRQIDTYYYSYYLLLAFSVFYLCGWIYRRLIEQNRVGGVIPSLGLSALIHHYAWAIAIVLCVIWAAGCIAPGVLKMTGAQTTKAILDGTLTQYDQEYHTIIDQLDGAAGGVEVEDIRTVPPFLSNLGLTENAECWTNRAIAEYYGVDYVKTPSSG